MHPVPRRPLPLPPPLRAACRFFPHSPGVAAGGVEVVSEHGSGRLAQERFPQASGPGGWTR